MQGSQALPQPGQIPALALEDQIERELLAQGVLDHVPPPPADLTMYRNRKPVHVQGTPVSERLIAERR
ncbi:MAG: hypothetical protein ABI614_25380 [Planctomycetota bacterium]